MRIVDPFLRDRSRWFIWSPVLIAAGIVCYFSLQSEPPLWLALLPLAPLLLIIGLRNRSEAILSIVFLVIFLVTLGFAAALLRTHMVAAPVLQKKQTVTLEGTVFEKETGYSSARFVIGEVRAAQNQRLPRLSHVRLTSRINFEEIQPGQRVRVRAVLLPPPEPAYPGAYDFQRRSFFEGIGAVGYTISPFEVIGAGGGVLPRLRAASAGLRARIADFVLAHASPDNAGFIIAIMTGDRMAIPDVQNEEMRISGLAHILSISGLHMGMIGGLVFFAVRLLLVLSSRIALYYPVKKIACVIALLALLGYLFVSGMSPPAVRSYIMASAVLIAVFFDRRALSLRMVALAAIILLLVTPESLTGPSFQMSFAAVVTLISLYEFVSTPFARFARGGGVWRRGVVYAAGVILTTLVAGLATAPFALYHFGQVAVYSVIANLLAIPLMGVWVMPGVILSFIGYPFGFIFPIEFLGFGVDIIIKIAHETASWPRSALYFRTFSVSLLIILTLLGLWFIIWRERIRWLALPLAAAAMILLPAERAPDILVSKSGNLYAIRAGGEKVYFSSARVERFEAERWQLIMGNETASAGDVPIRCDPYGCVLQWQERRIAFPETAQSIEDDCRRADIIISRVPVPKRCARPYLVIDRFDLWREGAHSLYFGEGGEVQTLSANRIRGERPWVPLHARSDRARTGSDADE